jgi:hypothetical protein
MFNVKRAAVLAVSAGLAAVPVVGLQGASASTGALPPPQPAKVCHPKWVVGSSDAQYDAETAAAGGNTEHPEGTVAWDDLSYRGC